MVNFTALISAVDYVAIMAAIVAIAAIKILPGVARWGFSQVITWFSVGGSVGEIHHSSKKGSSGSRSSSVHPVNALPESKLEPESRFKVFGAIFGFFSSFFSGFFSFFRRKNRG